VCIVCAKKRHNLRERKKECVCVCVIERGGKRGWIEASFYERNVLLYKIPLEIFEEKLLAKNDHPVLLS